MATPGKEPEGRLIYSCRESQRKNSGYSKGAPRNDYDGVVWEQQRVRCKFASDAYSWEQLSKLRALEKQDGACFITSPQRRALSLRQAFPMTHQQGYGAGQLPAPPLEFTVLFGLLPWQVFCYSSGLLQSIIFVYRADCWNVNGLGNPIKRSKVTAKLKKARAASPRNTHENEHEKMKSQAI